MLTLMNAQIVIFEYEMQGFKNTDRYRDWGRYKTVSAATVTVFGPFHVENKNHRKIQKFEQEKK